MTALKPRGQRPRCLYCDKELRPNFKREHMPLNVDTGEKFTHMVTTDYRKGTKEERTSPIMRSMTEAEKKKWRKDHPPQFEGTYGGYSDNRFCGLNCGYRWAVQKTGQV